jgi:hypothetical protein
MPINMNNPETFTIEAVRELIASKDDSRSRQIRISEAGDVYLSDSTGFNNLDGVRARFCTFSHGTDHVGAAAAQDPVWVGRVFRAIRKHWDAGTTGYIEIIEL